MSEAITFDTHRFVKHLTASGFTEAQAEALAEEQVHLLNSNLATRDGLEGARSELEVKMEQVKSELELKIEQVRSELDVKIEQARSELEGKIEQARSELELKIEQVKSELEVKIEKVGAEVQKAKADILKWMTTALIAQTALVSTIVAALIRIS